MISNYTIKHIESIIDTFNGKIKPQFVYTELQRIYPDMDEVEKKNVVKMVTK